MKTVCARLAMAAICVVVMGTVQAADIQAERVNEDSIAQVTAVVDAYIAALQSGDTDALRQIYLPEASYYFFRDGKLTGGSIDILYEQTNGVRIPKPIVYEIPSVSVSGRIACASLDIVDMMGVRIYDMFTLVMDDDGAWRMASKVARRP
ncbi:MAG: nuclear transport factor 2 family protein [Planctomycetaceae bacterium]|nr:nuclear transport factor 2 family protein [Planctomycetaceae bacterium]